MTETKIIIYGIEDLKKSGGFKKKNNILELNELSFFKYLKENNLTINSQYIDLIGEISNDKRFRCSYNNIIIGTSQIVKDFQLYITKNSISWVQDKFNNFNKN